MNDVPISSSETSFAARRGNAGQAHAVDGDLVTVLRDCVADDWTVVVDDVEAYLRLRGVEDGAWHDELIRTAVNDATRRGRTASTATLVARTLAALDRGLAEARHLVRRAGPRPDVPIHAAAAPKIDMGPMPATPEVRRRRPMRRQTLAYPDIRPAALGRLVLRLLSSPSSSSTTSLTSAERS